MSAEAIEHIATRYSHDARHWFSGHSELYAQWATGVAQSRRLLEELAALPPAKQQPNLLFAAARFLGCGDVGFAEVEQFMVERWPELRAFMLTHSTQTNEAGRCASLLPVFSMIAEHEKRPLALIEVGPSAGLCLLLDLYSYSYDGNSPIGTGSPLISCVTSGNPPLPTRLPEVAWRAGVDVNPLDGTDPHTIRWLRALVWPGQTQRLAQLDDALVTLQRVASGVLPASAGAPKIVAGDLLERVESLVAAAPEGSVPVVFHSAVLAYLDSVQRQRFASLMSSLNCYWVSNESFFMDPSDSSTSLADDGHFSLALNGVRLARTGQHGAQLHWLAGQSIF